MAKFKKILGWIGTVTFGLLIFAGGISAIFWLLATLNVLPIKKWQVFKKEKLKLGTGLSIILGIALFFIGGSLLPDADTTDKQADKSLPVVETIEPTEETTEITETSDTTTTSTTTTTTTTTATTTITTTTTTGLPENSTFSVHYIDVGQADAALVECDGKYMLIDGGNVEDSSKMYSILKNLEVENLDIIVCTHEHEDHSGGLAGALNKATADLVLTPNNVYNGGLYGEFLHYAELNGNGATVPSVGDTYTLGSATIDILGVNSSTDTNNTSIVLMITYGETKFLFTGDAEREAEQVILESGADLSCDVLKVGHHGSDTSTSYVWLNEIMPEYAVISVGKDNSYGHPTDAVLSRLRDAEVKTYRTDLNGDIYATSDGKTVTITTDKTASDDDIFTEGQIPTEPPTEPPTEAPTDAPVVDTPATRDWVINTNTGKFHYPSCSSAKKIKSSNRWDYNGTRDDVVGMGYSPCGNCHP